MTKQEGIGAFLCALKGCSNKACLHAELCETAKGGAEDIMGCNPDHKAQIYKAHKKMDMHEYDFKTLHNGEVVTFDKPMKFNFF
jgi:hypothetical protein